MNIIKEKSKKYCVYGLMLCCVYGCGKSSLLPVEYVYYMESSESGMRQEKTIEDIQIIVQYKTAAYIAVKEEKKVEKKSVKEIISKLKGMQYYTIKYSLSHSEADIMKYQLASESDYYERLNYMSFGMQQDVFVVQGKDTLPCVLFNHVRNYGISPYTEIVLGFEEKESGEKYKESKTLVIEDKAFGLGYMKFLFAKNNLNDLPELKTE